MTLLADQPFASGLTNRPEPPPWLPDVDAARDFYLYGSGATGGVSAYMIVSESLPPRLTELYKWVARQLSQIQDLRQGWDGHRAKPITRNAVDSAVLILASIFDEDSLLPQIFPLPDGGIQVDWYADDEIEIEIDGDGSAHVLASSAAGNVVAEGILDPLDRQGLTGEVAKFLKQLSFRVAMERLRT